MQKGRCWAMMKMWKLSHTDVCDCGEGQTRGGLYACRNNVCDVVKTCMHSQIDAAEKYKRMSIDNDIDKGIPGRKY